MTPIHLQCVQILGGRIAPDPAFLPPPANNLLLLSRIGSGVHGFNIPGTDDEDYMGICIESPSTVLGLDRFEQYTYRTQPEGHRSGPGDMDLTVYSLRKWMRLAVKGNPSVLLPLFTPASDILAITSTGHNLRANAHRFRTLSTARQFLGYMRAQRERMMGLRGGGHGSTHTNRPELIEQFGYDTKFAAHMIRLGLQGIEFLTHGSITLPMPNADQLKALRLGAYTRTYANNWAINLEREMEEVMAAEDIPERPDPVWVENFLVSVHRSSWDWWPSMRPDASASYLDPASFSRSPSFLH